MAYRRIVRAYVPSYLLSERYLQETEHSGSDCANNGNELLNLLRLGSTYGVLSVMQLCVNRFGRQQRPGSALTQLDEYVMLDDTSDEGLGSDISDESAPQSRRMSVVRQYDD